MREKHISSVAGLDHGVRLNPVILLRERFTPGGPLSVFFYHLSPEQPFDAEVIV